MLDQILQCFHFDHRHVAGKHKHERVGVFETTSRRFNSITSSALPGLNDKTREFANFSKNSLLNFLSLMANDDDYRARIQSLRGPHDVRDQRGAAKFVQDLCTSGLHSRPETGRHD
jgi:hypothetical protein